jgi:hypothetical protein
VPFNLNFSLEYKTRKASKEFLGNINPDRLEIKPENMDEYFIIEAYKSILSWFKSPGEDESLKAWNLYKKLYERIRIIWYEVDSDEDAVSLFTRLNIGRIPLTNAELVKALFFEPK